MTIISRRRIIVDAFLDPVDGFFVECLCEANKGNETNCDRLLLRAKMDTRAPAARANMDGVRCTLRWYGQYLYSYSVMIAYRYGIGESIIITKTSPCSLSCVAFFCVRFRRMV